MSRAATFRHRLRFGLLPVLLCCALLLACATDKVQKKDDELLAPTAKPAEAQPPAPKPEAAPVPAPEPKPEATEVAAESKPAEAAPPVEEKPKEKPYPFTVSGTCASDFKRGLELMANEPDAARAVFQSALRSDR